MLIMDIQTNAKLPNLVLPCLHHELQNCIEETWTQRAALFDKAFDCQVVAHIIITTGYNTKLIRVNGTKSINQVLGQVLAFDCIPKLAPIYSIKGFAQIKTDCPELESIRLCMTTHRSATRRPTVTWRSE